MNKIDRRRVILVTDGDPIARVALQSVATRLGLRLISKSGGNPTPITGSQIVELTLAAAHDPVIVMLDDNGTWGQGSGEQALKQIVLDKRVRVIGVLAVASHTRFVRGVKVDFSIDFRGKIIDAAVNKDGMRLASKKKLIYGDTVDILRRLNVPVVMGIGDIGKMKGWDALDRKCPVTTAAIEWMIHLDGRRLDRSSEACYHPMKIR